MYKVTTISFLREDPVAIKNFEMMSSNMWADTGWRIRNYIIANLADAKDAAMAGRWVMSNLDEMTGVIKKYYDNETANNFLEIMKTLVLAIASKVDSVKSGISIQTTQPSDYDAINSLCSFLDGLNHFYWKKEKVCPIIQSVFELCSNQILAREAMEWEMDLKYMDEMEAMLLKFADIFSAGIVAQKPEFFVMGENNAV